jgi:hypothetical protein
MSIADIGISSLAARELDCITDSTFSNQPNTAEHMAVILNYCGQDLHDYRRRVAALRVLAIIAAASAAFTPTPVFVSFLHWGMNGIFAVGYLVAAGLIWRALDHPSLNSRRAIWGAALISHGIWTFIVATNLTHGKPPDSTVYYLFWWGAIAATSLAAFILEPRLPA